MKTIRIGRSSNNDIVLNDPTVSSQHAVLTISDNTGSTSYRIKDLNSRNGTYVNGVRVTAEVPVKVSDTIKLGNYVASCSSLLSSDKTRILPVNAAPDYSDAVSQKKIGRTAAPVNDISFPHQDVSSSHAVLIKRKNGEVVIVDKGSTNGTYVNGVKVPYAVLKPGDRVMIANKYPLMWESIYPAGGKKANTNVWSWIPYAAVAACVVLLLIWAPWKPWEPGRKGSAEKIFAYYDKAVALIYQTFYFEVSANGEVLGQFVFDNDQIVELSEAGGPMGGFGTGFFVSKDGMVMTNRHVMNPNMTEQAHVNALKQHFEIVLEQYASALQGAYPAQAVIYRNAANNVSVEIKIHQTGVAMNDTYVTSFSDFLPCTVLGDTGSDEIDLGLIQLNSKSLPEGCTTYVDLSKIDDVISEGKNLYTIGFPRSLIIGTTAQGVEAQKQSGQISQTRGNVQFGHNLNIDHGSSGSPIFSEKGHLIGVVNAGFLSAAGNFNIGIQAKHAQELINQYK